MESPSIVEVTFKRMGVLTNKAIDTFKIYGIKSENIGGINNDKQPTKY